MSKKDYVFFARELAAIPNLENTSPKAVRNLLAARFASHFAKSNKLFDREKFLKASNYGTE